jgi:hypothetical protein
MRLGPTASQRGAKMICAQLGQRWATVRAGDGDTARPRLVDSEGSLQWFSCDSEDTKGGGGPWRSSRATQRRTGCTAMKRGGT